MSHAPKPLKLFCFFFPRYLPELFTILFSIRTVECSRFSHHRQQSLIRAGTIAIRVKSIARTVSCDTHGKRERHTSQDTNHKSSKVQNFTKRSREKYVTRERTKYYPRI